jgi:gamma-glutamyl hercynylcysteine S-oxide synthase
MILTAVWPLSADEWKPRHDLVSHTGVMNLSEPPPPDEVFFFGPESPLDQPAWLEGLKAWRGNRRTLLRYNGADYDRPELEWTQRIFSQVQLLIWDRSLYDSEKHDYAIDRFLSETESRIGPIDAVLIWHVYPNLGVDDRNQFDLLHDLPGGIAGLRRLVEQFHNHGVKVFFPFLAWDTGTRPESSDLPFVMSQLMKDIGADGINFDTLESVPFCFRQAFDGYPLALEPQFQPRDESISWTTLSWNDWVTWEGKRYPFVPMVSKSKWMEPRHAVNVTDRFTRDKTDSLQHAFFNGQGYATLENLWGFWYGDTPRDAEALLRCTRIERTMANYLRSPDWEPHTPMIQSGVFGSRFPGKDGTLWTIVNRNEFDVDGPQLAISDETGEHYYDLWHGVELQPTPTNGKTTLSFDLESLGYGAILATSDPAKQAQIREFMEFMSERSRRPLGTYSREWMAIPQTIVEIAATKPASSTPPGMARIPEADFDFNVRGIEIEGGNDPGVDVQYPWENEPRRTHHHRLHLHSFYIDRTPVTNAEFKKFLDHTHYHPADDHNFLRDWQDDTYPKGWENKPVTWVSIEDARAYCEASGKRLPHEWEWQYAAQSADGRAYPWGANWRSDTLPAVDHGPKMRPPSAVSAFPGGASPFGVLDLVGNVSQWTDEYRDPHTRAAIVRGGSSYEPTGSIWYFPQTYRLDEHEKYLLMSPGRDRAGTIGLRCVVDAP